MEVISGIYQITNLVNGKFYIGSSVDILRRWATHKAKLNNRTHQNPHLINAWHKYGEASFKFEVLEDVESDELIKREQYWLDTLKPYKREKGYNCAMDAGSNFLGRKHSLETRKRMSVYQSNRPKRTLSKTHVENIRKANKGRVFGDDIREKMSEARKGMVFSEEHRQNISLSKLGNSHRKGKKLNDEQRLKITGENNARSKLKEKDVVEIKILLKNGVHPKEIAPEFNVSESCIKGIKNNYKWKHVSIC